MALYSLSGVENSMKTISNALSNHLDEEVTTICSCWKITRLDGTVFAFTDHDQDLTIDNILYESQHGYNRTAIESNSDFSVDNLEVTGFLDSDKIEESELRAGLFDRANVEIFVVNWKDLSQGIMKMRRGWFGEVTMGQNGLFTTEIRGLNQALSHNFIELFTPECKADFCDTRCKLTLADYEQATTITATNSRDTFTLNVDITEPAQGFIGGTIRFTSGDNDGAVMEIIDYDDLTKEVAVFTPFPYDPEVGQTVVIASGCDKRRDTCVTYGNVVNMRAEPDVPGQDELYDYPDAG